MQKQQASKIFYFSENSIYESNSSESASAHNPQKNPNFNAPAPTKGILKKCNSNPNLNNINNENSRIGTTQSVFGLKTKNLETYLMNTKSENIKRIMELPKETLDESIFGNDIWTQEQQNWIDQQPQINRKSSFNNGNQVIAFYFTFVKMSQFMNIFIFNDAVDFIIILKIKLNY